MKYLLVLALAIPLAGCGAMVDVTPGINIGVRTYNPPPYYGGYGYYRRPYWRHRGWW